MKKVVLVALAVMMVAAVVAIIGCSKQPEAATVKTACQKFVEALEGAIDRHRTGVWDVSGKTYLEGWPTVLAEVIQSNYATNIAVARTICFDQRYVLIDKDLTPVNNKAGDLVLLEGFYLQGEGGKLWAGYVGEPRLADK